ncbi:MAG TPA: esterase-like activity of phytase family protein [Steroidobacteraceae bacterium]|jgi:glycerophosphoryl diester phosphodiesterase|nr:esterase-like activity of phytase family protein [Steroidobacteraceae bacterium]
MLALLPRALKMAAALVAACSLAGASFAQAPTPAKPASAAKKPAVSSKKLKPKPGTATAKKPVKPVIPPPPPPPPAVELIGIIVMPADAMRAGPPSGQFDGEGRRGAAPRFEAQPVQGVSSIKPGGTAGLWWALSDNGFGGKWNSSDYRLCIYLFDIRPRTEAGTDSRNALQAVIELSDPARFFPWRLANESDPERLLTGLDADPESLVTMPDESFWIGDEFGPWLMHFSVDGDLLAPPVELPDNVRSADHPLVIAHADTAKLPHSRGLEAMDLAADNKTLVSILEGTVTGDAPKTLRVQRYDTSAGKWLAPTLIYELDADTVSVTDLSLIDGNRFVVIERDDLQGDAARAKRVYSIDLDHALPGKPLQKKLVIDLLAIGNSRNLVVTALPGAPFRFPYLTTESIQVLDRKHVVIVNDNNYPATGGRGANVKDATEWIWLELANPL